MLGVGVPLTVPLEDVADVWLLVLGVGVPLGVPLVDVEDVCVPVLKDNRAGVGDVVVTGEEEEPDALVVETRPAE